MSEHQANPVHEPFDFGVTLDGEHRPLIQCRVCFTAWPCLVHRYAALEAENAALRAGLQRASDYTGINAQRYYERYGELDVDPHVYLAALLATEPGAHGEALLEAARAFVTHHDAGQAPNQPKTYAEEDVWHAEWDRRLDALRALVPDAPSTEDGR